MESSRRDFLARSLTFTCLTIASRRATAAAQATASASEDVLSKVTWMNAPASVTRSGTALTVTSRPKTDFRRKTYYGYVTDNGHFLSLPVRGDFVFEAWVNGADATLYDQAGFMVRADAKNWLKCGTELVDGRRQASVVFTGEFSDWSTMRDLSETAPVWWRAARKRDSIETLCSLDGEAFTSVQQGYFPAGVRASVGVMCAAPEGPGFEAVFDRIRLQLT